MVLERQLDAASDRSRCGSVAPMSNPHCARFSGALLLALLAIALDWITPPSVDAASRAPAYSRNGMVVTSQADATRAGVEMLAVGGNAVDAAVASAFAVGVTQPFSTGLGGPQAASEFRGQATGRTL